MKQFFDQAFWQGLVVIALLYALGFLAYGNPLAGWLLVAIFFASAWLAYTHLDHALGLAFLELFSNPHGVLVAASVGGFSVSLRMAIFAGVMLGWGMGVLRRRYPFNIGDSRLKPFLLLALAVALGFTLGALSRDPLLAFKDGNAYLYLLYLLPILSVPWTAQRKHELLQRLAAGAVWVSALSLVLLYVFSHFGENVLRVTYTFFRDLRVAEITVLGGGLYRIFIQSQFFVMIFGMFVFALAARHRDRRWVWIGSLVWAVILLSLSRSFWVALIPALVVACCLLFIGGSVVRVRRLISGNILAIIGGMLVVFITTVVPIPSQRIDSMQLADALKDRATEASDMAISSRWNLLRPMWTQIAQSPLVGFGFGKSVTFQTDDPRARALNPDGTWTTVAMEWGWLELWLKMGIFGPVAFLYAAYEIVRRLWGLIRQEDGWIAGGLVSGLVFLLVAHFFSPYLNHPIGLGFLLFIVPFLPTKKSAPIALRILDLGTSLPRVKEPAIAVSQTK